MDQSRIMALKKKADEDKGFFGNLSEKTDAYLQEQVVDPLTAKGYPNLGAGLATVPSSAVQFLANREKENAKPDAIMMGEGVTSGKLGEPGSRLPKEVYEEFFDRIAPVAKGDTTKFNSAMAQMESAWLKRQADAGAKAATAGLGGAEKMKASDQVRSLFAKPKDNVVVKEVTTTKVAPAQTARKSESYGEEFTKDVLERNKKK